MSTRLRTGITATASLAVIGATVALAWSAVATSSARVSATTETSGFITAGTVELETATTSRSLLFDTSGLYPGRIVEGCVELDYSGSIPGDIRMFADAASSTGLERYLDLRIEVSRAPQGCRGIDEPDVLFDGRLAELFTRHPDYTTGLRIGDDVPTDDRIAVRATAQVVDDNDAQGRAVDFSFVIEVRP